VTPVVVVVVTDERWAVDGMGDAFGNTCNTAAEGVILALVVVIAHITFVFRGVDGSSRSSFDSNFFSGIAGWVDGRAGGLLYFVFGLPGGSEVLGWASEAGALFLEGVTGGYTEAVLGEICYDGAGGLTELAFGGVESGLESGSWSSNDASFAVVGGLLGVGAVRDVELGFDVAGVGFLVSVEENDQ
jgi:hypothetical protein